MWPTRLFWKVFVVYAVLSSGIVAGHYALLAVWQRPFVIQQIKERLRETGLVLRATAEPHLQAGTHEQLQQILRRLAIETNLRLTILAPTGEIVADSMIEPDDLARLADDQELRGATEIVRTNIDELDGVTAASSNLGSPMLYVLLSIRRDGEPLGYVRAASPLRDVDSQISLVQRIAGAFCLGILAILLIATYLVVDRMTKPIVALTSAVAEMNTLRAHQPLLVRGSDEVAELGTTVNTMHRQLADRITELRDNNARLADVMGNMAEGVLAIDREDRVLLANPASVRLLEINADEVIGRPLWEITRQRVLSDAAANVLRSGRSSDQEFETNTPSRRVLNLRATRLPGDPSPGVIIVLHDVTELRRLENLRREFVANVSHELKTPLSAIKAYAETLRLGAMDDPEHNLMFIARIEEQAERLHQLILDLLHLARVEAGHEVFDIVSVPLRATVDACIRQFRDVAAAKQVSLVVETSEESLCAAADEEGLRTIISNLVDNAIKYTPDGGRVTVRWRREQNAAVLEVQDTGIGIPKQHQARIFERFYRVDKARSRELGGTGLGLSIVKHLVQAFGGSVGVESQPRAGTIFRIALPTAIPTIHPPTPISLD
jgi:two-component system phosphate regulon sensor histidine kinase PhoR